MVNPPNNKKFGESSPVPKPSEAAGAKIEQIAKLIRTHIHPAKKNKVTQNKVKAAKTISQKALSPANTIEQIAKLLRSQLGK